VGFCGGQSISYYHKYPPKRKVSLYITVTGKAPRFRVVLRDIKVILFSYLCQPRSPFFFLRRLCLYIPPFPLPFFLITITRYFCCFPLLTFGTVRSTVAYSRITSFIPTYKYQRVRCLTLRHRASCILGQAFRYSPENAFYIFNQQIYFIISYLLDRASLI